MTNAPRKSQRLERGAGTIARQSTRSVIARAHCTSGGAPDRNRNMIIQPAFIPAAPEHVSSASHRYSSVAGLASFAAEGVVRCAA